MCDFTHQRRKSDSRTKRDAKAPMCIAHQQDLASADALEAEKFAEKYKKSKKYKKYKPACLRYEESPGR